MKAVKNQKHKAKYYPIKLDRVDVVVWIDDGAGWVIPLNQSLELPPQDDHPPGKAMEIRLDSRTFRIPWSQLHKVRKKYGQRIETET